MFQPSSWVGWRLKVACTGLGGCVWRGCGGAGVRGEGLGAAGDGKATVPKEIRFFYIMQEKK